VRWLPIALVAVGGAIGGTSARAAQDEGSLQQQVAALQQMVLDLQSRLAELERAAASHNALAAPETAAPAAPEAAAPAAQVEPVAAGHLSEEARLKLNWSKVSREMDQNDVIGLLGAPSKQTTLDGRTVWYYYYPGAGAGSVFFTDAGRVSSRQSPFGFGW